MGLIFVLLTAQREDIRWHLSYLLDNQFPSRKYSSYKKLPAVHSFISLSYDRPKASSKASSPLSAI